MCPKSINIAITVEFKTKAVYEYWNESHSVNIAELRPEQYTNTEMSPKSINIAITVEFKTKAVYEYWNESHSVNIAELRPEQYTNTECVSNP